MTAQRRYYRLGKCAVTPVSGYLDQKSLRDEMSRSWGIYQRWNTPQEWGRNGFRENGSKAKTEERTSEKLPEIERESGGFLPRLKLGQKKQVNVLIHKTCCNYENDNCLLLDDGEERVCPQTLSYSVCCKRFRQAVLLQDKALEAEISRSASVKRCVERGAILVPRSNRAIHCEACAKRARRRQKNVSDRKQCRETGK